jgi:hypothetical protein
MPDPAVATAPPTVSDTANMLTSVCGTAWLSVLAVLTGVSAIAIGTGPSRAAPAINPQVTIRIRNLLMPALHPHRRVDTPEVA